MADDIRSTREPAQYPLPPTAWWARYWAPPSRELLSAGYDGELVVAKGRIGLGVAVMLLPIISILQDPRRERWIALVVTLVATFLALLSYAAARRHLWHHSLSFVTSLGDVTMVSLAHAVYIAEGMPAIAANSRTNFFLYALAIGATALRFDLRVCIAAGAAAVVQYAGVALWANAAWLASRTPDVSGYGQIDSGAQIGRLIVLVAMTWLTMAVVRQSARLRLASTHDPLTSLLNRRYFDERFGEELERSRRAKVPLAVAILDVDHFKRINDNWGHPAGDEVLRTMGSIIRQFGRRTDVVARYGGEEFVMMLEGQDPAAGLARLEKLRMRIAEHDIPVATGAAPLHITLSGGLAVYPDDGTDADALLRVADQRLLQAKRGGRNRVVHTLGESPNTFAESD